MKNSDSCAVNRVILATLGLTGFSPTVHTCSVQLSDENWPTSHQTRSLTLSNGTKQNTFRINRQERLTNNMRVKLKYSDQRKMFFRGPVGRTKVLPLRPSSPKNRYNRESKPNEIFFVTWKRLLIANRGRAFYVHYNVKYSSKVG